METEGNELVPVSADVVVYEKKPLVEVFEGLTKYQAMYLSLILRGMTRREAKELVGLRSQTMAWWTGQEEFQAFVRWAMSPDVREKYSEEAMTIFAKGLSLKAQEFIDFLINKGLFQWETVGIEERKIIMQAVNIAAKRGEYAGKTTGEPGSFEELIMRRRIES
jgi:hypothetical protein